MIAATMAMADAKAAKASAFEAAGRPGIGVTENAAMPVKCRPTMAVTNSAHAASGRRPRDANSRSIMATDSRTEIATEPATYDDCQ